MAFDEGLAARVREALGDLPGLAEKKMFGGVGFLLNGNMACGVHGESLMVRLPADETDAALGEPGARQFDMTGRPMKGWILVDPDGHASDEQLRSWVGRGVAYAETLPPK